MTPFVASEGAGRLVVSMPHVGLHRPDPLPGLLRPEVRGQDDADWHVDRLYAFAGDTGAATIRANWSRWYIDLNRPRDGASLYPGQATTGLCPTETFAGEPLYEPGDEPDAADIAARLRACWEPYHARLSALIAAARVRHGRPRLLDAHSIVSHCPRLFDGRLPDINIGTDGGRTCSPELLASVKAILAAQDRFSWVVDGRFRGGHITRHYGRPDEGVDAIQIELAQAAYMDEARPDSWDDARAKPLRDLLRSIVARLNA